MSLTVDQVTPTAQDLTTTALKQWDKLQTGFLTEEVYNPTESFPRRPWIDEPSGSVPFDEQGGQNLGVVGVTTIVLDFFVPNGMDGVIKWISNNTVFPFNNFSGDLKWQILQNGRAIRNFDNIRAEKGTIQIPRPISPIRIYSGDHIQFTVIHVANVGLNGQIVCSLNGYYYPNQGLS